MTKKTEAHEKPEAEAQPLQIEGEVRRAKVNRGSRRRIERSASQLNAALDAAIADLDTLAFVADDDGTRIAEWPAVKVLRATKELVNEAISELLAS